MEDDEAVVKYVTDRQIAAMFLVSRRTVWRWVKSGALPQPFRVGPRVVRWLRSDIDTLAIRTGVQHARR